MNNEERQHLHKLIDHLIAGKQVSFENDRKEEITCCARETNLQYLMIHPMEYKIVERPMVYVYEDHGHMAAITSNKLNGMNIENT